MSDSTETQLILIPAVLIAIAAILVDATFLSDAFRLRIWAQLPLWLAASLQGAPEGDGSFTYILIHIIFFLTLTSAGYDAFRVQCRWWTSDTVRADYFRLLAHSMILPLLYSFIWLVPPTDMPLAWMQSSGLFSLSFLALCGWRWTALRKRRIRQEHVGMPTVESLPIFHSTRSLEESEWREWTPSEVLTWMHGLEGDWSSVCSQLAPERISGSVLESLTVGELRSMGLPYGPAQLLVRKIKDLTFQYPPRQTSLDRDGEHDELEMDRWYKDDRPTQRSQPHIPVPAEGLQPDWYQDDGSTDRLQQHTAASVEGLHPATDTSGMFGELDDEAVKRAKDLFRGQFGLELPEIRVRSASSKEQSPNCKARHSSHESRGSISMGNVARPEAQVEDNGIPLGLLDSMPPHVREVAEERPDLLRMLWKQRQKGEVAQSFGLSKIHELRMQDPAYASRFVGAQAAAEIAGTPVTSMAGHSDDNDEVPDQSSDGERTGLLRQRAARQKYAAIR
jgi:hypothetical protein